MVKTFRPRKRLLVETILGILFFLAMAVLSATLPWLPDSQGESAPAALSAAMTLFWSGWLVAAMLALAAYFREQAMVDEEHNSFTLNTLFRMRTFNVTDVKEAIWQLSPSGGRIRFRTAGFDAKIDFDDFSPADQLELIRSLRNLMPEDKQNGWPMFCHKIAIPLRDGRNKLKTGSHQILVTRQRYLRSMLYWVPATLAIGSVIWWAFGVLELWILPVVLPIMSLAFLTLLALNTPREGRLETDVTRTRLDAYLLALIALSLAGLPFVGAFGERNEIQGGYAIAVGALCLMAFIRLMFLSNQDCREQAKYDSDHSDRAPEKWRTGEQTLAE